MSNNFSVVFSALYKCTCFQSQHYSIYISQTNSTAHYLLFYQVSQIILITCLLSTSINCCYHCLLGDLNTRIHCIKLLVVPRDFNVRYFTQYLLTKIRLHMLIPTHLLHHLLCHRPILTFYYWY